MQVEVLEVQVRYTFESLRMALAADLGCALVPETTLRNWLRVLGIGPDRLGFYHPLDLKWVGMYATYIRSCAVRNPTAAFKEFYEQRMKQEYRDYADAG